LSNVKCSRKVPAFAGQSSSVHRLRLGLRGSLIRFATLAFVHQRQISPSSLPTLSVFLAISTHFTAPLQVPTTPVSLKVCQYQRPLFRWAEVFEHWLNIPPTQPFTPSKSG